MNYGLMKLLSDINVNAKLIRLLLTAVAFGIVYSYRDAASLPEVLVLIHQHEPDRIRDVNVTSIQESFKEFIDLFGINLDANGVEFALAESFGTLDHHLHNLKYSTIIYVMRGQGSMDFGFCELSQQLFRSSNKNIIFWPCPRMKKPEKYLPSYETISFAVKRVSQKFNWTEAIIFATGDEWGLPLAVAANLNIPYRIEIGVDATKDIPISDDKEKVIIISSSINTPETLTILNRMENFKYTKTLLIDLTGAIFNNQNDFFQKINDVKSYQQNYRKSNLFVLTILTEKLKQFLNNTLHAEFEKVFNQSENENRKTKMENGTIVENRKTYKRSINNDKLISLIMNYNRTFKINSSSNSISNIENVQNIREFIMNSCGNFCENSINSHISYCENKFKFDSPIDNDIIRNFCEHILASNGDGNVTVPEKSMPPSPPSIRPPANSIKKRSLSKQSSITSVIRPSYGEYFSLFDFIASIMNGSANQNTTTIAFDFIILDFHAGMNHSNEIFAWHPYLILQQGQINGGVFTPDNSLNEPYDDWYNRANILWSCGFQCWSITVIALVVFILSIVASAAVGISVRYYLLKKRLSKGPNKIVLSTADFVFPVDTRRVDEGIEAMLCCWLQQLQEFGGPEVDKPDLLKGSIGSLKNQGLATTTAKTNSGSGSLAKHNTLLDMRARYNGDLVQLKELPTNQSNELKSKAMDHLVMMHGLRHENVNPLIGWLSDPSRSAMVFEYCSRGSLQDVLIMDEIKLDWSFRLSLLTDLVRGMRYLHSSPLRVHGALTSRNCVVDARWVLKVTDYGLAAFSDAQGITAQSKTTKQLLWTAPEILRNSKGIGKYGTQSGDVYSFGIIMQEVVVRGEPYCMLSLSPDEIILKIKKPPPLIRPSVSKGAAPPEAINIMRQCWAEMPDMRPDFNSVYERFKQLNHGRKVNFVDTMFQMLEKYSNNLEELIKERTEQLDIERKKTEQLLNRMLPSSVAEKLKVGLSVEPEEFADVTIYFSDIVGFTTIAAHCSPVQVVDLLNDLYTCFDATINAYSVYKVETIGDAYMVVSGLPVRIPDHAEQIATMALDLLYQSGSFRVKHLPDVPLQLRIGLHTGPCCAGVVGLTMPRYCLFGDTVNTASRMESTGSSWRIHLSEVTRDRLEKAGGYYLEPRGPIEIKGKGLMNTYWLLGKKGFDRILPTPPSIGLAETLLRNSINLKAPNKTPCISTNHSSSQSSSLAGETLDVKVEITPPVEKETAPMPNSHSLDSNNTISLGINILDYTKPPGLSSQSRKMSEISQDGLLNPITFPGRFVPSPSNCASTKLFKKFEDTMDLSLPYNHYRCLSPSEHNLTQCHDNKYIYGFAGKIERPGSSRLLRRQFSLDKEDCPQSQQHSQQKQSLDIPPVPEIRASPTSFKISRMPKQASSVTVDLEKIEEIPLSPTSLLGNHKHEIMLGKIPGSEAGSPISRKDDDINGTLIEKHDNLTVLNTESIIIR